MSRSTPKRPVWGLRVNGIREGGAPYASWSNGREAWFRAVNRYGYRERQAGNAPADDARSSATLREASRPLQSPRPNLSAQVGPWRVELVREPF
jgi:hypothetical protein